MSHDRRLGLLAFLAAIAYIPAPMMPLVIQSRWVVLAIGLPLLCRLDPRHLNPGVRWQLALGLAWAALSVLWAPDPMGGALQVWFLVVLSAALLAGANTENFATVMTGLAAGLAVSGAMCVPQWFGWTGLAQETVPAGLFFSREPLAEAVVPVLVWTVLTAFARRGKQGRHLRGMTFPPKTGAALVVAPLLFVPILLCQSRVAWLAVAVGMLYGWRAPWQTKAACVGLLGVGAAAMLWGMGDAKLASATTRWEIWKLTLHATTLRGQGIGWFATAYPQLWFAHSDLLQGFAELGVGMLCWVAVALWAIWPWTKVVNVIRFWFAVAVLLAMMAWAGVKIENGDPSIRSRSPHRLRSLRDLFHIDRDRQADGQVVNAVLVAGLVECVFSFPFHMPVSGFLVAFCAGHAIRCRDLVRLGEPIGGDDDAPDYYRPATPGSSLDGRKRRGRAVPV